MKTLYRLLTDAERAQGIFEQIKGLAEGKLELDELDQDPKVQVAQVQRASIESLRGNHVLEDAIDGVETIEGSLLDLGEVNAGFKRYLPRRVNPGHNQRLEHMAVLIGLHEHLKTRGFFSLDTFTAGLGYIAVGAFAYCHLAAIPALNLDPSFNPEAYESIKSFLSLPLPSAISLTFGVAAGMSAQGERKGYLLLKQAKYLDRKLQELYAPF